MTSPPFLVYLSVTINDPLLWSFGTEQYGKGSLSSMPNAEETASFSEFAYLQNEEAKLESYLSCEVLAF